MRDLSNLSVRKDEGYEHRKDISIFLCLAPKAVHMEVVGDLTTESFLAAMRRFSVDAGFQSRFIAIKPQRSTAQTRRTVGWQTKKMLESLYLNEFCMEKKSDTIKLFFLHHFLRNFIPRNLHVFIKMLWIPFYYAVANSISLVFSFGRKWSKIIYIADNFIIFEIFSIFGPLRSHLFFRSWTTYWVNFTHTHFWTTIFLKWSIIELPKNLWISMNVSRIHSRNFEAQI